MTLLVRIAKYIEDHRTAFDLSLGGSIGLGTSLTHWWEHFTQPENLYKFYDSAFGTFVNTILGAVLLWALHKYVLKSKKNESKNN